MGLNGTQFQVSNVIVKDIIRSDASSPTGMLVAGTDVNVANCYITNTTGAHASDIVKGFIVGSEHGSYANIVVDDTDNTNTAAAAHGVEVAAGVADNTLVGVGVYNGSGKGIIVIATAANNALNECVAKDNGADSGIDNTNGDNFSDGGTNTFLG